MLKSIFKCPMQPTLIDIGAPWIVVIVLLTILSITNVSRVFIPTGHVGVITTQPIITGRSTVDRHVLPPGNYLSWYFQEIMVYSSDPFARNYDILAAPSKDNMDVDMEVILQVQITDAAALHERFGPDWFRTYMTAEVQTAVRRHTTSYTLIELAKNYHNAALVGEIRKDLRYALKKHELPVRLLEVNVWGVSPTSKFCWRRLNGHALSAEL